MKPIIFHKIAGILLILTASGCVTAGSGVTVKEDRVLQEFTGISFKADGKMNIMMANENSVEVICDDNLLPYIVTSVQNGTLFAENISGNDIPGLVFNIRMKELNKIDFSGSGSIVVSNTIKGESLTAVVEGSGKLEFKAEVKKAAMNLAGGGFLSGELIADNAKFQISGPGSMLMKGNVANAWVGISASGEFLGSSLVCSNAEVELWGSGNCEIGAQAKLKVKISGAGNVKYKGKPKIEENILGVGKIIFINE
ncbi:MAG: hypothetical protein A2Y33_01475 [Spirochaetes bacterium GWF1_51_8]|nr:MAG: hypothetical protein A2Y33_01475 [Spirochaetes bacterium GWF1_51_8]